MALVVRRKELKELLKVIFADPEWSAKMDEAKTTEEIWKVLVEFCRVKNYDVPQSI